MVLTNLVHGQVCTGSLGDPVINNTFGKGPNPGPPLPISSTTYPYVANSCPGDGFYTIANFTSACHGGSWHTVSEDHTPGDVGGYMMIVNASPAADVFYVETVNSLCGGTTYEFAAWILNIGIGTFCGGNPKHPNVSFIIETTSGVNLKTYNTGDIPFAATPTWQQYGTFFTTPPGTSTVVVKMRNNNNLPGGCGNDLVLDDITFRPCSPLVTANSAGSVNVNICSSDTTPVVFSGTVSSGFVYPFYQWQVSSDNGLTWTDIPGANSLTYTRPSNTTAGTFLYRLSIAEAANSSNAACRTASNVVSLTAASSPATPSFIFSPPDCINKTITFTDQPASPAGALTKWIWNFGDGSPVVNATTNANQVHTYSTTGTFIVTLQVQGNGGCPSPVFSDTVTIASSPAFDFTFTNVCTNQPVQFTETGAAGSSYNWDFGDATTSTVQNPTKSYTASGTYNVTLQVNFPGGCSGSVTHPVTIGSLPSTPSFTASPSAVCINQPITFTGKSTDPAGSITQWVWNFGDGSPVVTTTPNTPQVHTYATAGIFTVTLQVKGSGGCISLVYSNTVTISPVPVAPSFTSIDTACLILPVTFTDVPTNPAGSIIEWTWNFGDGSSVVKATTNTAQSHTYTTVGTYTVTLQLTGVGGCTSTIFQKQITIISAPVVDFTFTSGCLTAPANFTITTPGPSGTQYQWTFGDGNSSNLTNPSHTYAAGGTYNVLVIVKFPGGCTGNVSHPITINPAPALPAFSVTNAECVNKSVTVINQTPASPGNIVEWSWNFGDGSPIVTSSTFTNQAHTYTVAGSYTISLTVKNSFGCVSLPFTQSITIGAIPSADFTFVAGCVTNPVQFAAITNAGTGASFSWALGDATTSTLQNPVKSYSTAGTYNVSLTIKSSIGCGATVTKSVTVASAPATPSFNASAPACVNAPVTFTPSTTTGVTKWIWTFADGSPVLNLTNNSSPTHAYTSSGTYNVTLQLEGVGGCSSRIFALPVTIAANPTVDFTFTNSCENTPVNFLAVANGTSYQWKFGDGGIASVQNPAHTYTAGGSYTAVLTVKSATGCTDSAKRTVVITAKPVVDFEVNGSDSICSNYPLRLINNSIATSGMTYTKIYWNWTNNADTTADNTPSAGENYSHNYPAFHTPAVKAITIKTIVNSGIACEAEQYKTIYLKATPDLVFTSNASACEGSSPFLINTAKDKSGMIGQFTYSGFGISPEGMFNPIATGPGMHQLQYNFIADNGCADSIQGFVTVIQKPKISAGSDKAIKAGEQIQILATSDKIYTYSWSPAYALSSTSVLQPFVSPTVPTVYTLTAVSKEGCEAQDSMKVIILKQPVIPNAFSPNNDGINDTWVLTNLSMYTGSTIEIFNRYGAKVFSSIGYQKPWDGTCNNSPVPIGVYYYIIKLEPKSQPFAGWVTLLR